MPELGDYIVNKLLQANGGSFELLATVLDNFIKATDLKNAIVNLEVLPEWQDLKEEVLQQDEGDKKEEASAEKKEEAFNTTDKNVEENFQEKEVEPLPFFVTETSVFPTRECHLRNLKKLTILSTNTLLKRSFSQRHSSLAKI